LLNLFLFDNLYTILFWVQAPESKIIIQTGFTGMLDYAGERKSEEEEKKKWQNS